MSDQQKRRPKSQGGQPWGEDREADFAAQLARALFGRHYVDTGRIEQILDDGEIVFRHRKPRE